MGWGLSANPQCAEPSPQTGIVSTWDINYLSFANLVASFCPTCLSLCSFFITSIAKARIRPKRGYRNPIQSIAKSEDTLPEVPHNKRRVLVEDLLSGSKKVPDDRSDDVKDDGHLPNFVPGAVLQNVSRRARSEDPRQHSCGIGHAQQHPRVAWPNVLRKATPPRCHL